MTIDVHTLCPADAPASLPVVLRPAAPPKAPTSQQNARLFSTVSREGAVSRPAAVPSSGESDKCGALGSDWAAFTFEFLIMRILPEQHRQMRDGLTRLESVAEAALQNSPTRSQQQMIQTVLRALTSAVEGHLEDEAEVFPSLLKLELAYVGECFPAGGPISLGERLQRIARRNTMQRQALEEIRKQARTFRSEGGAEYRALYRRAEALHRMICNHLDIEETFLFRRAERMQAEMFG